MEIQKNKIVFLIDGFNLYHSIVALQKDTGIKTKWLDINSLCRSYISLFGKNAIFEKIFYFSAIPTYLSSSNPDKIIRHEIYIKALENTNIEVILGRFKEKTVYCNKCKSFLLKHEEKETDVAIALKLIEVLIKNIGDTIVIVTGDTDLAPAYRTAKALAIDKKVVFAFPYARKNKELAQLAPGSFSISQNQYIKHQFNNPLVLKDCTELTKPLSW